MRRLSEARNLAAGRLPSIRPCSLREHQRLNAGAERGGEQLKDAAAVGVATVRIGHGVSVVAARKLATLGYHSEPTFFSDSKSFHGHTWPLCVGNIEQVEDG